MRSTRPLLLAAVGVTALLSLSACSKDDTSGGSSSYDIKASDDACKVSETTIPAGKTTFEVQNIGSDVTEVYVYGKSGSDFTKIMGEVENIGPGTTRDLDVDLSAGDYQVACKPGMVGDGKRTDLTVTGGSSDSTSGSAGEAAYDRELELEIEPSGAVKLPAQLTAQVGEKIEFKLENGSTKEYYLQLVAPDGKDLGEAEAAANGDGEFVATLEMAGAYTLKTYADGAESQATSHTMTVSDAG